MSTTVTPYRSEVQPGRDGFGQSLRAEFTKFRTVRGWVIGMVVAALVTILLGFLTAAGGQISCGGGPDGSASRSGAACRTSPPLGPDGEIVSDSFYFVHQPLTGDGSITVRVTAFTGLYSDRGAVNADGGTAGMTPGVQPWSKAGVIIKPNMTQGSTYAAMMVTGNNGVRMQYNYTHDVAGAPGAVSSASPRWLRLVRSGDNITGYGSLDGTHWTSVGTATLANLPSTVQIGLFASSPDYTVDNQSFGGVTSTGGPTLATGSFDNVTLQSSTPAGDWTGTIVGSDAPRTQVFGQVERFQQSAGMFTLTGTGDIAPGIGQRSARPA